MRYPAKMTDRAVPSLWLCVVAVTALGPAATLPAKPIYGVSATAEYPTDLAVYEILGPADVVPRGQYAIAQLGSGAMGIAIDSGNDVLFVTFEDSASLGLVNAKTMSGQGRVAVTGASNLAGIVFDHDKRLLYCADRGMEDLYILEWAECGGGPVLQQKDGSPVRLPGSASLGIALDEINDLLFVTSAGDKVRVYRTSDWSLARTITLGRPAISVAVDFRRQAMYTGAGYMGDTALLRHDLTSDVETSVEVGPLAGVMGLAVDDKTGLVYLTTGRYLETGGDELQVYTSSLELLQNLFVGNNPTGLAIPLSGYGWNPLVVAKRLVAGGREAQGAHYAQPGDVLTYEICFDNSTNTDAVTNVVVVDKLPAEVNFVSVGVTSGEGVYDSVAHTFTYRCDSLAPNATGCFRLVVQVKADVPAGLTLTNRVTAVSAETFSASDSEDATIAYKPLALGKRVVIDPNQTVVGDTIYVDPGSSLTYEISVANPDNTYRTPEVVVVDTLPEQVTYLSDDGNDGRGYYDPNLHAYVRVYATMEPNAVCLFRVTVWVHDDVPTGTIITNSVLVNGLWSPPATAETTVVTKHRTLTVRKTIVSPISLNGGPVCAGIGDTVTYRICIDNTDSDFQTHNVFVTDVLPAEVDFVSAGSGGVYDPDSRACLWSFPVLEPNDVGCADLVVRVNDKAVLDQPVTNTVAARADETPPVEASVPFVPCQTSLQVQDLELIYSDPVNNDSSGLLQAVLTLPSSVRLQDVNADERLVLDPGGAKATTQIVYGRDGKVKIRAFFDTTQLLASVDGYGRVTVTVKGWLRSGRTFVGQKDLLITSTMRHKYSGLHPAAMGPAFGEDGERACRARALRHAKFPKNGLQGYGEGL